MSHYQNFQPYVTTSHVHKDGKEYVAFDFCFFMPRKNETVFYKEISRTPSELHYELRFGTTEKGWEAPTMDRVRFKGILGLFRRKEFLHFTINTGIPHKDGQRITLWIDKIHYPHQHKSGVSIKHKSDYSSKGHDGSVHFP